MRSGFTHYYAELERVLRGTFHGHTVHSAEKVTTAHNVSLRIREDLGPLGLFSSSASLACQIILLR